ncbi:putative T7SS-secreted protein [Knoellia sp. CPCC 206453]|uniref:endonuclease toxin domain-containing protein n=1 Tax=Knoellia pratensis TaxID=3404796 RepID=UPI00361DCD67
MPPAGSLTTGSPRSSRCGQAQRSTHGSARLKQAGRWQAADEAFSAAAVALDSYRTALVGARESAEYARTLYDTGLEKRAAAIETVQRQRAKMRAEGVRVYVEPDTGAGGSEMERAAMVLETARAEVKSAGEAASRALNEASPPSESAWKAGLRMASWSSPFAAVVGANWDTLSDSNTWFTLAMLNRDPSLQREFGAGLLIGASDVLMSGPPNSPVTHEAWKSATNTWAWQNGMDPSSVSVGAGALLGREILANAAGPQGKAGLTMKRAAEAGVLRAEQLIAKHSVNSVDEMWRIRPFDRGYIVEALRAGNLPYAFRTFDRVDGAVATSVKSMDLSAPTYANSPAAVERTLNRYLDSVTEFATARRQGVMVNADLLEARNLEVIIPKGSATPEHQAVIDATIERAREYSRLHPDEAPVSVKVTEL